MRRRTLLLAAGLLVPGAGGPALAQSPAVPVRVNAGADRHPISPLMLVACDPGARARMRVAATRLDATDPRAAILTVPGPGAGPHVKAFRREPDGTIVEVPGIFACVPAFLGGARVAGLR
jgi:hypothetical protein